MSARDCSETCMKSSQEKSYYLHFNPAVHRLEDFSVVYGTDLNQESETLGHYKDQRYI